MPTPGYPDVVVDFGKRFSVHVEVSSNKQMGERYFRYELDSTLKHMQAKRRQVGIVDYGLGYQCTPGNGGPMRRLPRSTKTT